MNSEVLRMLISKLMDDVVGKAAHNIYDAMFQEIYSSLKVVGEDFPGRYRDALYFEMNRVALEGTMGSLKTNPIQRDTAFSVLRQENRLLQRMVAKGIEHGFEPQQLRECKEFDINAKRSFEPASLN